MEAKLQIAATSVVACLLVLAGVTIRSLGAIANGGDFLVLTTEVCQVTPEAGRLVVDPGHGDGAVTLTGRQPASTGAPVYDSAVYVLHRRGLHGPIVMAHPHHFLGACPEHGALRSYVDDHGRIGCKRCGSYFAVDWVDGRM